MIAKTYLKGWFSIDLISILPISYLFESSNTGYNKLARIARLPKLYRLARMMKMVRMLKMVKERSTFRDIYLILSNYRLEWIDLYISLVALSYTLIS